MDHCVLSSATALSEDSSNLRKGGDVVTITGYVYMAHDTDTDVGQKKNKETENEHSRRTRMKLDKSGLRVAEGRRRAVRCIL